MSERERIAFEALTLSDDVAHELHRRVRARRQRDAYQDWHEIYGLGEVAHALRLLAVDLDPMAYWRT